ncbi:MAG: chemotaxis protein CheW [Candidatus Komeilibacteria bacterium]|nr:chemotaxis protein CheW [Candidatus Komeilibacteria bacterium]
MPSEKSIKPSAKDRPVFAFTVKQGAYALPLDSMEGVTPASQVVPVPGNRSRVFVGIAYLQGQLVSIIDVAPLDNKGSSSDAKDIVMFRWNKEYYGILAHETIGVIAKPHVKRSSTPKTGLWQQECVYRKRSIALVDVQKLITEHVCA